MPEATNSTPPHRPRRALAIGGVLLGALVLGVVACEIAGWPFLVSPVEHFLTKTLKRDFRMQDVARDDSAKRTHATIRFFGGLQVNAPHLFIAAPAWSKEPFFLDAENASLRMGYLAIWRASRGGALDLKTLEAKKLVVHAERRMDNTASWQFGDPTVAKKDDKPLVLPVIRKLSIADGLVTYVDEPLKANVTTKLHTSEGASFVAAKDAGSLARAASGLHADASGTYNGIPLTAGLHAPGVMVIAANAGDAPPVPIVFNIRQGKTQLDFTGTVRDVMQFSGLTGVFRASGESLAKVGEPLGVTLPSTGAFNVHGRLAKQGNVWNVVTDTAVVGDSHMNFALTYDAAKSVPLLSGRVTATQFFLKDLLPTVGVSPDVVANNVPESKQKAAARDKNGKVIPQRDFDLPSLNAMNANVLFAFDRAELGSAFEQPIEPLKAHLTLMNGKLLLDDIEARTADGNVGGLVGIDGSGPVALWRTRLHWDGVKLERWLKQERKDGAPPYISGRVAGRAELQGRGKSTADFLASLDGSVMTTLRDGKMSHLIIEGAGIDIAQALGVFIKGDDAMPMNCAVVDLAASKGVLTTRSVVIDTPDSTVVVDGDLSMTTEAMDLRAVVSPKDFSPAALRSPIHVKGTFGDPKISVEAKPIAARLGASVALALVNPLAAILPLLDFGGPDKDVGCSALLTRARTAVASAAKKPDPR